MTSASAAAIDPRVFRATMSRFATGVTIVSTTIAGQIHGMTANAFLSVSLDPPLVLVSIGRQARMHALLTLGQRFGVSVLAAEQEPLSNHFAGRPTPDARPEWIWEDETPLLRGAIAQIVAEAVIAQPAGDHTLFIGQVEYLAQHPGQPLLFHAGAYARLQPGAAAN